MKENAATRQITGIIPGKVNRRIADDTTINAKIGEYIFPDYVVKAIGVEKLDQMVMTVQKQLGIPVGIGPKRHDQPDNMGRMDAPVKKRGIADLPGMSDGGLWTENRDATNTNWKDMEALDQAKIDAAASAPPTATTPTTSTPVTQPPTQAPAPTPEPSAFTGAGFVPDIPPLLSSTPAGSSYVGGNYNKPNALLTAFRGKPNPFALTANKRLGIADLPGHAAGGLIKTWEESNAASNNELERNFTGSASVPVPTKEQTMTEAGLTIARPRGISTIAADNSTPFVPMFSGSPTPPAPVATNAWTETLKNSGQALAAPAPSTATTAPARNTAAPITTTTPTTPAPAKRPGIADGMESISQTAVNAGLPAAGSPVGASTAAPIALVNGPLDAAAAGALRGRVDWSPGSANVKRRGIADAYDEQVKSANRINAAEKERLTGRSVAERLVDLNRNHNTAGLSEKEKQVSATDAFNADRKGIADVLTADTTRSGQKLALEGQQYTADKQFEGTKATGDSRVAAAEAKAAGLEAAFKVKAASSEQAAKDSKELIKTYYDSIKDRSLPAGFEGQHISLAKDLANAEDPNTDFGIYYAPGSSRPGIATKRSVYGPLLAKYEQAGYKGGDAHSRAYRDLLALEKAQGVKLHKAFPRLDSLTNRVTKPADVNYGG